jgi:hypothetical protein
LLVDGVVGTFNEHADTWCGVDVFAEEGIPMEGSISQTLPAVLHVRFLIFDWSIPNVIMGVVLIAVFFLAAWARLPKWIERGRDQEKETKK